MIGWRLVCPSCERGLRTDARARRCRPCGVGLELRADSPGARPDPAAPTLLGRYRDLLPPIGTEVPLSLGEGRTPLLESASIGRLLRLNRLAFKLEAANPTGGWVDRGTVALVQHAREAGVRRVVVLADGGLALSTARYAARAGLGTTVVMADEPGGDRGAKSGRAELARTASAGAAFGEAAPSEAVAPDENLREAGAYENGAGEVGMRGVEALGARFPGVALAMRAGARLVRVRTRPAALAGVLRRATGASDVRVVDAEDPVWAAGLGALAFELAESETGSMPDVVVIATATGAEGPALAAGFRTWRQAGLGACEPTVLVVGHGQVSIPDGLVVDARDAAAARRLLAEEEGIAASLSSAAALAGVVRLARAGEIAPDARVVVVLADERPSLGELLEGDPQLVGRVLNGVSPEELASVLARPAF